MKLIIGIGNPDQQYQNTRHNVGFTFVDYLAKKSEAGVFEFDKKSNSFVSKTKLGGVPAILAKPQIYVNKSGESVLKLIRNLKLEIRNLVIVHDDLDVPFGNIKISFDKNSGGHKGVESVMKSLKTKKFYRLRIGLGAKPLQKARLRVAEARRSGEAKARQQSDKKRDEFVRNYVLSKFSKLESDKLKEIFKGEYEKLLLLIRSTE